MLVRELMSTEVVTVDVDATVRTAVETMLAEGVGSVIVMDETVPVGIFTGSDAIRVGYECDCSYSTIPVTEGMSDDLVTGEPGMTVRDAAKKLTEAGIEKLPIVEDFEVVGIITLTDIVREHAVLLQEANRGAARKAKWGFTEEDED